ncbi:MAG TPA: isochorismate synthase, partial [Arthrobacter sp.]|nr:isochorismate synthase [Arthrobacter sp.]
MTSTFRTLTVPLDGNASAGGLPQFLVRDDVLCWTRREAGLVGFGEIARFTATGPERFLEADIWWRHLVLEAGISDSVGLPGTGPVAFGSFAFSKKSAHESRLIVPEIVVGVRDGQYWLTQLTFDDGELTEAGALAALDRWLTSGSNAGSAGSAGDGTSGNGTSGDVAAEAGGAVVRPSPSADGATLQTGSLSEEDWMAAVAAGVAEIRTGALEKLVLARDIVATVPA